MIPKKIHYCWFGLKPLPKLAKRCIDSWVKYCPGYEIIQWNENNYNVFQNAYTKKCYEEKKYAFLSDYVRLQVVKTYGGIYFDTDVEVIRSFDKLLDNKAFFGFEIPEYVASGLGFGAEAENPVVIQMLNEYKVFLDGEREVETCPRLNTKALLKLGLKQNGTLQKLDACTIYPADYFNPFDDATGVLTKTSNTYSIHWYGKSWMSKKSVFRNAVTRPLHRLLGVDFFHKKKLVMKKEEE